MRIRTKVLVLLLTIALVPLMAGSVLHRVSMRTLGLSLAAQKRATLIETAEQTLRTIVGENQTPCPKLQIPSESGGETGTRKKSGWTVSPAGTERLRQAATGRYSIVPAWQAARFRGVA